MKDGQKIEINTKNHGQKDDRISSSFQFQNSQCYIRQCQSSIQQYILQIMEYLAVCFDQQCRLNRKQILCSGNNDIQLHQSHNVELIHPFSPFIRSLKTQPIKFHDKLLKMRTQLQEQYERSVQQVISALKTGRQQCERRIRDIYELNWEQITFKLFQPHLREKTPKTEMWLTLINWKKDHPTEDIKQHIQDLPDAWIKDYTTKTSNLVDSFLSNLPKSSNKLWEESNKTNIEKLQANMKEGSKVISEISKQIQHIYENSIRLQEIKKKSQISLLKKGKDQREETLKQLAEVFCNSKSVLRYMDIGQSLRTKIRTKYVFSRYLLSIFRRVYNGIIGQVNKDLRYRGNNIKYIDADLKKCRIWMQSNEVDIFTRCVKFYMNLDRSIVINMCEIYTIYVPIIIRVMEKAMKNHIPLPCDSPAQRLYRDMNYLYSHFGNFHKVAQLVTNQYYSAESQQVKQQMNKTWRNIVVDTYAIIKEKESIQNVEFFQLLFQEQDFCRQQFLGGIVRLYINYRMHGRMNKSDRESLEQSMMIVVRNGKAIQLFTNKEADPSQGTYAEDQFQSLVSFAVSSVETMIEERSQSLQCPSTAKREQLQSLELNYGKIKQQGSYTQSVHHH